MVLNGGSPEEEAPQKDDGRSAGVGQAGLAHGVYLFTAPRVSANNELKVNEIVKSITTFRAKAAIFRIEEQAVVFNHVFHELEVLLKRFIAGPTGAVQCMLDKWGRCSVGRGGTLRGLGVSCIRGGVSYGRQT